MCKALEVKAAIIIVFKNQKPKNNKPQDPDDIIGWIKYFAKLSGYTYGERRIKAALDALSFPMSRYKVAKLMKEAGVWVRTKKKYKVRTNSDHKQPVLANLLKREFDVDQPEQLYVAVITYVWRQEGWLYLAVVIDLYSRKIVG